MIRNGKEKVSEEEDEEGREQQLQEEEEEGLQEGHVAEGELA